MPTGKANRFVVCSLMNKNAFALIGAALCSLFTSSLSITASAQGTAFTYQGRLSNNGGPANGTYDVAFTLFGTNVTGNALSGPVTNLAVPVSNGLFTTTVDFGNVFTGGSNWLEIAVSSNAANAFITLAPRQQLTPTPYAVFATTASNVSGTVSLTHLPSSLVTNGATGVSFSGAFAGSGAGLSNVPGTFPWQSVPGASLTAAANQGYLLTNNAPGTVTLPGSANVGDIVAVSGVGTNGWQVVAGPGQAIASYVQPAGVVWTPQNSGTNNYQVVASSADGVKLVAGT